jgi:TonB family protein
MRAFVGLASSLVAFGAAQAADLNDPVWDRAPGQDDWAKAYPAHAAQAGISGAVKMKCAATADGMLSGCAVIQEAPTGEGFGAAALSLATGMALKPAGENGQPVAGRNLIVPVRFEAAMLQHPGTIVGQPDWLKRPSGEDLAQFYPPNVHNTEAHAIMECVVSTRGLLDKCQVTKEDPAGSGAGAAALAMSATFLMRPMTVDGLPVGGAQVVIPIGFIGQSSGGGTVKVVRVAPWMATPTLAQMSAVYPKGAMGKIASGHVVLRCDLRPTGMLGDCDTLTESPGDAGFREAAKDLIKDFRVIEDAGVSKQGALKVDVPFDFRDPSQPSPRPEIYDPAWMRSASFGYAAKVFPAEAAKAGLKQGRAIVSCLVKHDGSLEDCGVVSEEPAGMGFGDAALKIAAVTAMNPWTAQGTPVEGGRIRLPIRLVAPDPAAQQAPPKP